MNTDEKKEIMENENGRKNEEYFDIPRGQVKHLKVNKRYNKSSRDILKDHCKTISKRKVNHYHCLVCQKLAGKNKILLYT